MRPLGSMMWWLCRMLVLVSTLLSTRLVRRRDERGDVPGWVLVTVMSAGIVVALGAVAKEELTSILRDALNSVK